ncbi:preprotein translocase subunit SecY [Alphaproteobacteria bacterium]|nr:preprotein translocase subunit SecY [Alphaproteobacteria bacterium]
MASAAEQLAANVSWSSFSKATELKQRLLFALGALLVYRLGTYIPMPGIDPVQLEALFNNNRTGILGQLDLFAGGAVSRMSIFALSIMPYISASIIMQLATAMFPTLEALKKDGETGRKKINQYTRYLTVVLALFQSYGIAVGLESINGTPVIDPGYFFRLQAVITLTGGTLFLMWLGEQITARGIGNGISLIIFVGIVANLPGALYLLMELGRTEDKYLMVFGIIIMVILAILFIVFMERAFRKVLVQYPKRVVGNKQFQGDSQHIPLKLNTAGVIPAIFASSILLVPSTLSGLGTASGSDFMVFITTALGRGQPLFLIIFAALIIFFAFFYTAIVFSPAETADNLKKQGGFVPGIRPGKQTADYLDYILTRLTTIGACYLALVCVLPEILVTRVGVSFLFGGTSILIVVSVTIDTVGQIHSHLVAQQYESLIEKSKLRSTAKFRDTKAKKKDRK